VACECDNPRELTSTKGKSAVLLSLLTTDSLLIIWKQANSLTSQVAANYNGNVSYSIVQSFISFVISNYQTS